MLKRTRLSPIAGLVLLFTLVFVSCGAPPATMNAPSASSASTHITATPVPELIDLHTPDELKARFNQDAGVPRIILLVSPT